MLAHQRARVKVPATSANLGPGFDVMGLCLSLYDELSVEVIDGPDEAKVIGEGEKDLPVDSNHLVIKSIRHTLNYVGASASGLKLTSHNRIPHARGLGSSPAAIVAGISLARELVGSDKLSKQEMIDLAGKIEGHPDNIAPCILGGATIAWSDQHGHKAVRLNVNSELVPIIAIPDYQLATKQARSVLPQQVSREESVFNISRTALLVHSLTQDLSLLFQATEDRLHQFQRSEVMPKSWHLLSELRRNEFPAVVSGAGPAILILATSESADAVVNAVNKIDPEFKVFALTVDQGGVRATSEN